MKDIDKNRIRVNLIKSGLRDLKEKTEEISKDEKEIERTDAVVNITEKILEFNNQNQKAQGLKILTPNQMLSRFLQPN